jgi:3-deoxy-D-manno-octulosonic-acid transferase
MPQTSLAYRILANVAVPAVPVLLRDQRQHDAHRARLRAPAQLEAWASAHRDSTRPLVWFHAPSVGEGLQARAVLRALRHARPDAQFIYTHYSPSAEEFASSVGADWSGYLGYDRRRDVDRMLAATTPDLLVFTKLDLWPELAVRASARGTRVAMVAATVTPGSSRLRWPARSLSAPGYAALDLAAAIAGDDAERMATLGSPIDRITVTGDPRIDSVLDAADQVANVTSPDPATLVAGSTWPEDETVVLGAFELIRDRHPAARLIIAPHDPTPGHLQRVSAIAKELGLPQPARISKLPPGDAPTITLVDKIGMLARLYGRGAMAYVGGGCGKSGIHSVLEPAAWACPVVIGPNDRDSRDARLLENAGALRRLGEPASVKELAQVWGGWLDAPADTIRIGHAARAALETERGAAKRSADLLVQLLMERSPAPG